MLSEEYDKWKIGIFYIIAIGLLFLCSLKAKEDAWQKLLLSLSPVL
jgi:hypothetical protein